MKAILSLLILMSMSAAVTGCSSNLAQMPTLTSNQITQGFDEAPESRHDQRWGV